ncbi:putative aminopeptidase W07G4.4 [Ostrinia furnacalis]|uniref:putative aminopeptidase W07G4.4 n=1 Tax=Ostrinia furnacalis TaxID=93504 RepID=UPI00103CBDF6|nr:putative aminopeptidase W07G4.4 [Ostrinia furnacalis]
MIFIGCVIFLEYEPESYDQTVMLVGKGVTYDTGGCDIKAGGAMAGMSRDKCGAAAVAGFLKACELLRPRLRVLAALGVVRNSVGEEAYVADELLRSRRGDSVRVGNTDAEGRLVMADLLAEMHERARGLPGAHIYSVATLTGHAHRAYGDGYTAALDNHAARGHAQRLQAAGEQLGDMIEVSTIRREDLAAHRGRGDERLHQADPRPSTATPRGHQAPAAFLLLTAGLHAGAARYTHLDVAASAGDLPRAPTAAPLLALAAHYKLLSV